MKKILFTVLLVTAGSLAQVGIGTTTPRGALDINTTENLGLVLPRVTSIENVTDGSGNSAINASVVYDESRKKTCFKINEKWICLGLDSASGDPALSEETVYTCSSLTYLKASNAESGDYLGFNSAISADGTILAVSAPSESSNATGVNGNELDNSMNNAGAVYIFSKSGATWTQEAYIKASNTEAGDFFGFSLTLNDAGNRLAVGAANEDSGDPVINGNQGDNSVNNAGAVYIFERNAGNWSQTTYLKAPFINTNSFGNGEYFGFSVDFDASGNNLAVGAFADDAATPGINPPFLPQTGNGAGAVHLFSYNGSNWQHDDFIKPAVMDDGDNFGIRVKLDDDGDRLFVASQLERSNSTTINSGETDNSLINAGAVYAFVKSGGVWSQEAYIKPWAIDSGDRFGLGLDINADGSVLAVSSYLEDSNATGIDGNPNDNSIPDSGAIFTFRRSGTTWSQQTYIKAPFATSGYFGFSLALNKTGDKLLAGASLESSSALCVNGDPNNTGSTSSGAAFLFEFNGTAWNQTLYIKAQNADIGDWLGESVCLTSTGPTYVMTARREDGLTGSPSDNSGSDVGAIYILE